MLRTIGSRVAVKKVGGIDQYTKLLIRPNGGDGSTSLIDVSDDKRAITTAGAAQVDDAQAKFPPTSIKTSGGGDTFYTPYTASLALSGDFAIDTWLRLASFITANFSIFDFGGFSTGLDLYAYNAALTVWMNGSNYAFPMTNVIDTWDHWAITRASGVCRIFKNGAQQGASFVNAGTVTSAYNIQFGDDILDVNVQTNGWFQEPRISIGHPRWTKDFIPPRRPYTR